MPEHRPVRNPPPLGAGRFKEWIRQAKEHPAEKQAQEGAEACIRWAKKYEALLLLVKEKDEMAVEIIRLGYEGWRLLLPSHKAWSIFPSILDHAEHIRAITTTSIADELAARKRRDSLVDELVSASIEEYGDRFEANGALREGQSERRIAAVKALSAVWKAPD